MHSYQWITLFDRLSGDRCEVKFGISKFIHAYFMG